MADIRYLNQRNILPRLHDFSSDVRGVGALRIYRTLEAEHRLTSQPGETILAHYSRNIPKQREPYYPFSNSPLTKESGGKKSDELGNSSNEMLRLLSRSRLFAVPNLMNTKVSDNGCTEALFLECIAKVCVLCFRYRLTCVLDPANARGA